jgi:hypothetical protein
MRTRVLLSTLLCVALGSPWAQGQIVPPAAFGNQLALGLSNDQQNNMSLLTPGELGVKSWYHYRNLDYREFNRGLLNQTQQFLNIGAKVGQVQPGTDLRPSYIISFFEGETNKDALIQKMQDPELMRQYFEFIKQIGAQLKASGQQAPVVFLEPDAWATILQARFHFADEASPFVSTKNQQNSYRNVLDFPASVTNNQASHAFLGEYSNTVGDLARGIIHSVRTYFPAGTQIGMTLSTWSAYAKGCADGEDIKTLNQQIFNNPLPYQGPLGIQTWGSEDIKISAFANVKFYQRMFDSVSNKTVNNTPDFFALSKFSIDAGFVERYPNYDAFITTINTERGTNGKLSSQIPGAGTKTFYWGQAEWDKWLLFSRTFAHGFGTPLVAMQMPLGTMGLPNLLFQFEDTFSDWLFSVPGSKGSACVNGACSWADGNFTRFKEAGFTGIWAGREGWPSYSTHYGPVEADAFVAEISPVSRAEIQGLLPTPAQKINLMENNANSWYHPGSSAMIQYLASSGGNRTLSPINRDPIIVNEAKSYSGDCQKASGPALGKVELLGGLTKKDGSVLQTVYSVSNTENSQSNIQAMKGKSIFTFAVTDTSISDQSKTAGKVLMGYNAADSAAITAFFGQNSNAAYAQMKIETKYAGVLDKKTKTINPDLLLPLVFRWYIFDANGQFVNSDQGRIEKTELPKYMRVDSATGDATIEMRSFFLMRDKNERKVGAGVYFWKGYIEEQSATIAIPLSNGTTSYQTVTSENQVINERFGVMRAP